MPFSDRAYHAATLRLLHQVLDEAWQAVVSKSVYRALDPPCDGVIDHASHFVESRRREQEAATLPLLRTGPVPGRTARGDLLA